MRRTASLRAIPGGSRVFLPGEARRKREVEERLLRVFEQWGFREMLTPAFEFYAPRAGSGALDAQTYRMVDLESGGLLALRADMTPQIARAAGTILAAHPPALAALLFDERLSPRPRGGGSCSGSSGRRAWS